MAKNTQERPLEVAPWANDNYNKVMAKEAMKRARRAEMKEAIEVIIAFAIFMAPIVLIVAWCNGHM